MEIRHSNRIVTSANHESSCPCLCSPWIRLWRPVSKRFQNICTVIASLNLLSYPSAVLLIRQFNSIGVWIWQIILQKTWTRRWDFFSIWILKIIFCFEDVTVCFYFRKNEVWQAEINVLLIVICHFMVCVQQLPRKSHKIKKQNHLSHIFFASFQDWLQTLQWNRIGYVSFIRLRPRRSFHHWWITQSILSIRY